MLHRFHSFHRFQGSRILDYENQDPSTGSTKTPQNLYHLCSSSPHPTTSPRQHIPAQNTSVCLHSALESHLNGTSPNPCKTQTGGGGLPGTKRSEGRNKEHSVGPGDALIQGSSKEPRAACEILAATGKRRAQRWDRLWPASVGSCIITPT